MYFIIYDVFVYYSVCINVYFNLFPYAFMANISSNIHTYVCVYIWLKDIEIEYIYVLYEAFSKYFNLYIN